MSIIHYNNKINKISTYIYPFFMHNSKHFAKRLTRVHVRCKGSKNNYRPKLHRFRLCKSLLLLKDRKITTKNKANQ